MIYLRNSTSFLFRAVRYGWMYGQISVVIIGEGMGHKLLNNVDVYAAVASDAEIEIKIKQADLTGLEWFYSYNPARSTQMVVCQKDNRLELVTRMFISLIHFFAGRGRAPEPFEVFAVPAQVAASLNPACTFLVEKGERILGRIGNTVLVLVVNSPELYITQSQ